MAHHTIIYNPAADKGQAGERMEEISRQLTEAGVDFTIHLTERMGHAVELAATAREAFARGETDVVVAAGGDGTVNEVLNGLLGPDGPVTAPEKLPAFGVLSVGRGNDFAYGVGVPTNAEEGIAVLKNGHAAPLDVGYLRGGDFPDGRYFGNGIGVGFDTIVGLEAAKLKHISGFASYLVGAFKTLLFYYQTPRLRMEIDSDPMTSECVQVSIMNGQRMGGGFFMAPDAVTSDGLFDLCIAGKPGRGQMLGLLLRYMKGTQAESPHITNRRAKEFSIVAEEGTMVIHADGETICTAGTEISFKCVHSALRIITSSPESKPGAGD